MADPADDPAPPATSRWRHVEVVVNAASGSVGPGAAQAVEAMLAARGVTSRVVDAQPNAIEGAVRAAVEARPDLLVILAGDGTARLAAQLCGAGGPVIAALPGGTMNMLPHALYGRLAWPEALEAALDRGVETSISGGEVDGRPFYVAAILGAPALWGPAREAIRQGRLRLAWLRAWRALSRAFRGRLRYRLDDAAMARAEALTLICPLVSRAHKETDSLEVGVLSPRGAAEGVRLGARTLMSDLLGDWRLDPAVRMTTARSGLALSRRHIPAVLDGEPHRLSHRSQIRFIPQAFRALSLLDVDPAAVDAREAALDDGAPTTSEA